MADAAYRTTTMQPRMTVGDIFDQVTRIVGKVTADITALDRSILVMDLNHIMEQIRAASPRAWKGFGERRSDLTWDPASIDTRLEMPEDFEELLPGGSLWLKDSTGKRLHRLTLLQEKTYKDSFRDGVSPYDNEVIDGGLDTQFVIFYGLSTNDKRFIELKPIPTVLHTVEVSYTGSIDYVSADIDIIEAPTSLHKCIVYAVAVEYLDREGFGERAAPFAAKRDSILQTITGRLHETGQVVRFRNPMQAEIDRTATHPRPSSPLDLRRPRSQ